MAGDILTRLRTTQCCDPVIDGMLGSAIEEIKRLRGALLEIRSTLSPSQAGYARIIDAALAKARGESE